MSTPVSQETLLTYHVWDRTVRIFHWINVIAIIGLISVGLIILYNKDFGVSSDGKILLKTIHVYFGYIFVLNLLWRLIWGFIGNRFSRWPAILPFGKNYIHSLTSYIKGLTTNNTPPYAGHNPLAKLMVALLFALFLTQATTGLVLAGTDLYYPPFGNQIADWVTGSSNDPDKIARLKPGSKEGTDPVAYDEMRSFRKPFITIHKYGFYVLSLAILLHILGVVLTELKEKNGLVSAMLTGNKVFTKTPIDIDKHE
ncbi:MAG: cytochrome b/b6 domain-containing protein [Gammaproteobacteria bacterium]|nr:cytochrome b/b6 domain-containing protein [Gammaproteobacteria bacterium]